MNQKIKTVASKLESLLRGINPSSLDIPLGEIEIVGNYMLLKQSNETRLYFINSSQVCKREKHERDINTAEKIRRNNPHAVIVPITDINNYHNYDAAVKDGLVDLAIKLVLSYESKSKEMLSQKIIDELNKLNLIRDCINLLASQGKILYAPRIAVVGAGRLSLPFIQIAVGRAAREKNISEIGVYSRIQ